MCVFWLEFVLCFVLFGLGLCCVLFFLVWLCVVFCSFWFGFVLCFVLFLLFLLFLCISDGCIAGIRTVKLTSKQTCIGLFSLSIIIIIIIINFLYDILDIF